MSLANELSQITNPARDELVVSGDLHAAVGMLETLDQKTKNMSMSKEKANTFMKVFANIKLQPCFVLYSGRKEAEKKRRER